MQVKVFSLRFSAELDAFDDRELCAFGDTHRLTEIAHHVVHIDGDPVLLVLVTWRGETSPASMPFQVRRDRVEASETLDPLELQRYEALRQWRNQHARTTGKPPYLLFNNRQALAIARAAPVSLAALGNVDGIGPSKVEAWGPQVVELLASLGKLPAAQTSPNHSGDHD